MPTPADGLLLRIATNLRALREQRGMTREQLATQTDVDMQLIKRIEGGRSNPALVVLSRLASALMISLSLVFAADLSADSPPPPITTASEPFDSEVVGETLMSVRNQRQLSRRALAGLVDLRSGTLRRYETGKTDPRVLELLPIARALSIDSVELVREMERRVLANVAPNTSREHSPGVRSRLLSQSERSRLWEVRLAPGTELTEEATIGVAEEIATATAGTIEVEIEGIRQTIRNGGSLALPLDRARRFLNDGTSTARLLRFQVRA